MKLLLDTHIFLWAVSDPARLSQPVLSVIKDTRNQVLVSIASAWEMSIKARTGKLTIRGSASGFVQRQLARHGMELLGIELRHLERLEKLPLHHRDPFDRLLVAQCMEEGAVLVSVDPQLKRYDLRIMS